MACNRHDAFAAYVQKESEDLEKAIAVLRRYAAGCPAVARPRDLTTAADWLEAELTAMGASGPSCGFIDA